MESLTLKCYKVPWPHQSHHYLSLKDQSQRGFAKYLCLAVFVEVLTRALRTTPVLTGLPGLPCGFPPPLPTGPGPHFNSAWGHQSLLQWHCSWPATALLDWSCLDSLGSPWPWLATLPSPDAHRMLIAPVPITTLRCSSSQAPWGAPCPRGHRPACVAAAPGSPTLREQPCFCCSLTALAVRGDV